MRRDRFLKDMGAVGVSLYLSRFLYLIRGVVTARFLGPSAYGIWGALGILLSYSNVLPLGSAEAVGREIPYHAQRGDTERVRKTKELAFSFNLYASLLASLAVAIFAILRRAHLEPVYFYGLLVVAVGITLQQLYFFYGIVLRAEKRFFFRSKVEVIYALINVPITIALVVLFGLYGLFAAFLTNLLLITAYLTVKIHIRPQLRISRAPLANLMRIGFPIYLIGLVYTVFTSVDRLVILKFLTTSDMGYYSIAVTLMTMLGEAPMVIAQVMSPNLIERYSGSESLDQVFPYVQIPTLAIAFFFPVLLVLAIFGFDYLVHYALPKFLPGFAALELLVLGSFFTGVLRGPSSFLLAVRKQMAAVIIYAIGVGIAIALNIGFVKAGMGLTGIALATGITYFLLLLMYVTYVYTFFLGWRIRGYLSLYAAIIFPFLFSVGAYLVLRAAFPLTGGAPVEDAGRLLLKCALYLLVVSPTLYYFLKRYGLWRDLVERAPWRLVKARLPRWLGGG